MNRRTFVRTALLGTVSSYLLAACGGGGNPTPTPQAAAPAPSPTPMPMATPTPAPAPTATPTVAPTPTPAPPPTLRFAYLRLGWAGCEAIDELKLLKERGWNIEWSRIDQISALANAYAAGQAEIIDMSAIIAAQMHEKGVEFKIFSAAVGTLGAILVRADLNDISSVPDLRGRKVAGVPGATTTQDMNAMVRKLYNMDLFTDTQFVQASAPPDVANLIINKNVDAVLIWEPVTSRLTESGVAKILVTQQELWKQVSGSPNPQVHVVYLARPDLLEKYPKLAKDIIEAQQTVADMWKKQDEKVIQAFATVTQLPPDIVKVALSRTTPLAGLGKDLQETLLAQWRFNRESGVLLQSDIWLDPEKARKLFWTE
jgi:ABC-type nitrate/sulfonate/bicarbonate transport system substrate-binding protein